jgi:hypothetical protein
MVKDIQGEKELVRGEGTPFTGSHRVNDLSDNVNPMALLRAIPNKSINIQFTPLVNSSGIINYASAMKQFAVFNPTTRVIKIGLSWVTTNDYIWIINANKMVVLPPVNFNVLSYLQETFTAQSVVPTLYAYDCWELSPSVSSIT